MGYFGSGSWALGYNYVYRLTGYIYEFLNGSIDKLPS
jgi:hypothetical protein